MELNNLKNIRWENLENVQGRSSQEIPKLLTELASDDNKALDAAFELGDKIYNQGTIAEVTSYVVPYLVDIMINGATNSFIKNELIELLSLVASGGTFPTEDNDFYRDLWKKAGADFDKDIQNMRIWTEKTRNTTHINLLRFWETLEGQSTIKLVTAITIAQFGRHETSDEIVETLIDAIRNPQLIDQTQSEFLIVSSDLGSISTALCTQLGAEQAENRLKALLDETNPDIRQAAQTAINELHK